MHFGKVFTLIDARKRVYIGTLCWELIAMYSSQPLGVLVTIDTRVTCAGPACIHTNSTRHQYNRKHQFV